ncbi:unnamed protein product [Orchesella dallaii]|uniref:Uncharacterized protein n=1 Tax=Orchesella dallaii TaxID=48710 RepID=A0ABP1RQ71_9HEXA
MSALDFEETDESGENLKLKLDLSGVLIQITTRYLGDYDYDVAVRNMTDIKNKGELQYEFVGGYAVDVFLYLKSLLNFTYKIRADVDTFDFSFNKNNLTGPPIDLYVASYSLIPSRAKFLDFTFVFGVSPITAFLNHDFEENNHKHFLVPFTVNVWITLVIVLLISPYLNFFQESSRITAVTFSITVVIVMNSYCGVLTSYSVINRYSITTMASLLNSEYKIMLKFGYNDSRSAVKFMLQSLSHIPAVAKLLEKSEASKFVFKSFEHAIKKVSESPSAYILDEETGSQEISKMFGKFPCSWGKIPVFQLTYPIVMYVGRKGTKIKAKINMGTVRMQERGILQAVTKRWIPQSKEASCYVEGNMLFDQVKFSQVTATFKFLIPVGILICPMLLMMEKYLKRNFKIIM